MRKLWVVRAAIGFSTLMMWKSVALAGAENAFLLQAMKRAGLKPSEVGGGIWSLQNESQSDSGRDHLRDHVILEHRSQSLMIPASLSKVVTALASLDRYADQDRFTTRVWTAGDIVDGKLRGDLILEGGGDPAFVSEAMEELAQDIADQGISQVQGDLIVDDSLFDRDRFDVHRESKRVDRAYDAPIGALSFDWNAVSIYVQPGNKASDPARVFLDPMSPYLTLENRAQTGPEESKSSIVASRSETKSGDKIIVTGSIPAGASEKVIYKSISLPEFWTGWSFLEVLKRQKILVSGTVKVGRRSAEKKAKMVAQIHGPTRGELVLSMMKFSNNFIAEMLTKNLAVKAGALPGTMSKGVAAIQDWLRSRKLDGPQWIFVNPSGLTNENRLTAAQFGQLLKFAYSDLRIYPEFTASLPIAGKDGTLKHRVHQAQGSDMVLVRAKTGLLKDAGVAGLAGYATTASGQVRAFAWIINEPRQMRDLQKAWNFLDTMAKFAATNEVKLNKFNMPESNKSDRTQRPDAMEKE